MFLISIIRFGIPVSWSTPPFDEYGNRSVHSLFLYVTANIFTRGRVSDWLFKLGIKRLDDIDKEYKTFERYMSKLIAQREIELKSILDTEGSNSSTLEDSLKDILGRLVYARLAEGKLSLTDDEIMGNCFLFVSECYSYEERLDSIELLGICRTWYAIIVFIADSHTHQFNYRDYC